MKEQNRLRLERLTQRYAQRIQSEQTLQEAELIREFEQVRDRVLRPAMEEIRAELRHAGHATEVILDQGPETPSIELALGLQAARGTSNRVGFSIIRWKGYPVQILAYLEVSAPKFDLERFARADELTPNRVEQLLIDAVEHIMSCNGM